MSAGSKKKDDSKEASVSIGASSEEEAVEEAAEEEAVEEAPSQGPVYKRGPGGKLIAE